MTPSVDRLAHLGEPQHPEMVRSERLDVERAPLPLGLQLAHEELDAEGFPLVVEAAPYPHVIADGRSDPLFLTRSSAHSTSTVMYTRVLSLAICTCYRFSSTMVMDGDT